MSEVGACRMMVGLSINDERGVKEWQDDMLGRIQG